MEPFLKNRYTVYLKKLPLSFKSKLQRCEIHLKISAIGLVFSHEIYIDLSQNYRVLVSVGLHFVPFAWKYTKI